MRKLTVKAFLLLLLLSLSCIFIPKGMCATEDFTTYTEVDPNNNITVYNASCFKHHVVENEDCYIYKDYGVGALAKDSFHTVDTRIENESGAPLAFAFMFSDFLDDRKDLVDDDRNYISIMYYQDLDRIYIQRCISGILISDYYASPNPIKDKWWYLSLNWTSSNIILYIYNNTARTSAYLEDTLSILGSSLTFQYIIASNTRNRGNVANIDVLVRNLELELVDTTNPSYILMGLNSTLNGTIIQFTISLTDNIQLDTCLLEWNNTGTLTNISLSISGSSYTCLFNQTLNASSCRVNYKFFFNDTSNNWGDTIQHFLVVSEVSPGVTTVGVQKLFVGVMFLAFFISLPILVGVRKKFGL